MAHNYNALAKEAWEVLVAFDADRDGSLDALELSRCVSRASDSDSPTLNCWPGHEDDQHPAGLNRLTVCFWAGGGRCEKSKWRKGAARALTTPPSPPRSHQLHRCSLWCPSPPMPRLDLPGTWQIPAQAGGECARFAAEVRSRAVCRRASCLV